jgi:hypothetical protein
VIGFFNMHLHKTVGLVALVTCSWISLQADSAKSKNLPPGVLQALAGDEKELRPIFWGFQEGLQTDFPSKPIVE